MTSCIADSFPHRRPMNAVVPVQAGPAITQMSPVQPRLQKNDAQSTPDFTSTKQTPLQRHLAHLARHGFNGVSSGPADAANSDTISEGSPRDSFANGSTMAPLTTLSGAGSTTTSTMGSIGSIKGRFSKFGSLNFARREA